MHLTNIHKEITIYISGIRMISTNITEMRRDELKYIVEMKDAREWDDTKQTTENDKLQKWALFHFSLSGVSILSSASFIPSSHPFPSPLPSFLPLCLFYFVAPFMFSSLFSFYSLFTPPLPSSILPPPTPPRLLQSPIYIFLVPFPHLFVTTH